VGKIEEMLVVIYLCYAVIAVGAFSLHLLAKLAVCLLVALTA